MTPDQLRELASRLTGLADGLDEIRRAVGDTADDPAADLRTAVAYLRQCADVQPAAWMRPDNRVREESFTGEQFSRSAQPPPIGTWVPLYLHPAPRPQPEHQPVSEAPGCWLFSNPEGTHKIEASSLGGLLSGIRSRFPDKCEPTEAHRKAVLGAVARGWCHPENANKEMDATLAIAIADEVLAINRSEPTDAQIVAVADVLLAWEAEISNRVSARVLAEDVIRAALAAKESK